MVLRTGALPGRPLDAQAIAFDRGHQQEENVIIENQNFLFAYENEAFIQWFY